MAKPKRLWKDVPESEYITPEFLRERQGYFMDGEAFVERHMAKLEKPDCGAAIQWPNENVWYPCIRRTAEGEEFCGLHGGKTPDVERVELHGLIQDAKTEQRLTPKMAYDWISFCEFHTGRFYSIEMPFGVLWEHPEFRPGAAIDVRGDLKRNGLNSITNAEIRYVPRPSHPDDPEPSFEDDV